MIDSKSLQRILGIVQEEEVPLAPADMIRHVKVAMFPGDFRVRPLSENVRLFTAKLEKELEDIGVKCVPFEETLEPVKWSFREIKLMIKVFLFVIFNVVLQFLGLQKKTLDIGAKFLKFGKKGRKGYCVFAAGEFQDGKMPVYYAPDAGRSNTAVAIVDIPEGITTQSDFKDHYEASVRLLAYHMVQVVIAVDDKHWILYNLNGSHPVYTHGELGDRLLDGIIPKLAAPLLPPRMSDFKTASTHFNPSDELHTLLANDLEESGVVFEKRGLFPKGVEFKDLPVRNQLFQFVIKKFLDERSGMSYGFLARQLPAKLFPVLRHEQFSTFPEYNPRANFFSRKGHIFLVLRDFPKLGDIAVQIPDVWVMTARSGADKTKLDRNHDLIKLGLVSGQMMMEFPEGTLKLSLGSRPSFDSRCILANAVGNAIVASLAKELDTNDRFANHLEQRGMAIAHWHGYVNSNKLPEGWHMHGESNPDVPCSTAQSAMFALLGKLTTFAECVRSGKPFYGDAHVEPNHGVNVTYWTLKQLGDFLSSDDDITTLGNKYLRPKPTSMKNRATKMTSNGSSLETDVSSKEGGKGQPSSAAA